MKICGFTIIRNAIKFDYPVVEAIASVLPMVDKFIVLAGNSEDKTEELIRSIDSPKIEIHHSVWDDGLRTGGKVLAVETNKAFDLIGPEFEWAFYIQSDEVVHEKYHTSILSAMEMYAQDKKVEGLLFKYIHFYGSYDYIGISRKWYRQEIRIIRNDKNIRSYRDAQGFRRLGKKLNVARIEAYVYHYGWVKNPVFQSQKNEAFSKLWHDDRFVNNLAIKEVYDYSNIDFLEKFTEKHPAVMNQRIAERNWDFDGSRIKGPSGLKEKILYRFEKWTGYRLFEYRNFKLSDRQ